MDFLSSLFSPVASLVGGLFGQSNQERIAQQNIAMQQEFAQHGISWRVADAKAAGINPLAALGAATSSFSNVVGDNSLGEGIARAGQDIGRAAAAASTKQTRLEVLNEQLVEAKIANVNADTTRMLATASQMSRANPPGQPPGIPLPQPHPLRTNWDLHNAPPLMKAYAGQHGDMIYLPSEGASQAMQNAASMPAQAVVAGGLIGENLRPAAESLYPGGVNWVPLRADAWRGVDQSQYVPF